MYVRIVVKLGNRLIKIKRVVYFIPFNFDIKIKNDTK